MENLLREISGCVSPDVCKWKIGPEVITKTLGKLVVMMGGQPKDIKEIEILNDKKSLRIKMKILTKSGVFTGTREIAQDDDIDGVSPLFSNKGVKRKSSDDISEYARAVLKSIGFIYTSSKGNEIDMYSVESYKKKYAIIEFNQEILMCIICDTDYTDRYLNIVAEDIPVYKEAKGDKRRSSKTIVTFAMVTASCGMKYDPTIIGKVHK